MKNQIKLYADNANRVKIPINLIKNANEASLYIYDVIDPYFGIGAKDIAANIAMLSGIDTLNIYINSPGGDVFEARAIMAEIARFKGTTIAHIDSLCASAATSIALACNQVEMSAGAFFMIHNASAMVWGDKTAMRDTADLLEKIEQSIIADYTAKTGMESDAIIAFMDAETWFSAEEALKNGFIDKITAAPAEKAKNTWNLSAFAKAPINLIAPPDPQNNIEEQEPASAGFFMSTANTNKLALLQAL